MLFILFYYAFLEDLSKSSLEKLSYIYTCVTNAGFEDRSSACCGVGLYGAMIGCLSPEMACNQASTYVWWDLYNPTPAVYSLLVDSAWSGRPFYGMCRPTTIQELVAT